MRQVMLLGALALGVRSQSVEGDFSYPLLESGVQLLFVEGLGRVDIFTNASEVAMGIVRTLRCEEGATGCSALAVQQSVQKATSKVVKSLANMEGVQGISTAGQSVEVISSYNSTTQVTTFEGYRSRVSLTAVVPSAEIGDVLDLLFGEGVNTINSVSYYVSQEQLSDAEAEALDLATKNALAQAKAVLDPLGKPIVETRQIVFPYDANPYETRPAKIVNGSVAGMDYNSLLNGGTKTVGYRVKLKVKFGQLNDTVDATLAEETYDE